LHGAENLSRIFLYSGARRQSAAKAQCLNIGDYEEMAAAAMDFSGTGYNVYAPLAIMRPDIGANQKGGKEDVVSVLGFVVDGDADKGKAPPVPPVAANYVVETSAGNLQHFLLLDKPLTPAEAEPIGAALKKATDGADSITDYSHVWRVPGSLNYPNAAKLKRGRSPEPQPVRVYKEWDRAFTDNETLRSALAKYKPEPVDQHSDEPPALNGYRIEEVSWWLDQKIKGSWKDDPDSPLNDNGEWIATAKAIKLNFPNRAVPDVMGERVCARLSGVVD
jgi:hypothetical protein